MKKLDLNWFLSLFTSSSIAIGQQHCIILIYSLYSFLKLEANHVAVIFMTTEKVENLGEKRF
jgi:hypothetical protein